MTFATRPHALTRLIWPLAQRTHVQTVFTFDDGPHSEYTPRVLDQLAEANVTAVFFVVGQHIAKAPHLLRRMRAEGHVVGNHTWSHWHSGRWNVRAWLREVNDCANAIADVTGERSQLLRPPLGKLFPATIAAAALTQHQLWNWSLDSNDWRCRSANDAERCARELQQNLRANDVVLLHDCHEFIGPILDTLFAQRFTSRNASLAYNATNSLPSAVT